MGTPTRRPLQEGRNDGQRNEGCLDRPPRNGGYSAVINKDKKRSWFRLRDSLTGRFKAEKAQQSDPTRRSPGDAH